MPFTTKTKTTKTTAATTIVCIPKKSRFAFDVVPALRSAERFQVRDKKGDLGCMFCHLPRPNKDYYES